MPSAVEPPITVISRSQPASRGSRFRAMAGVGGGADHGQDQLVLMLAGGVDQEIDRVLADGCAVGFGQVGAVQPGLAVGAGALDLAAGEGIGATAGEGECPALPGSAPGGRCASRLSMELLPWQVVTPSRSRWRAAYRIATASSWPGSQSITILVRAMPTPSWLDDAPRRRLGGVKSINATLRQAGRGTGGSDGDHTTGRTGGDWRAGRGDLGRRAGLPGRRPRSRPPGTAGRSARSSRCSRRSTRPTRTSRPSTSRSRSPTCSRRWRYAWAPARRNPTSIPATVR